MSDLGYAPLSRDELAVLLAPGGENALEAWNQLIGGFRTLLGLRTSTYSRPLVPEADARASIPEALAALKGSPVHPKAFRNARTLEQIERRFREGGASPELDRAVDDFIEALVGEWDAIDHFPELPPDRTLEPEPEWKRENRYAAGSR